MGKSNAFSSARGWDFQRNAAIVLLVDYYEDLVSITLEGKEDIDIKLIDDQIIYVQTKCVVKREDFRNVLRNLKSSLRTLNSVATSNPDYCKLIYMTNTPNPFSQSTDMNRYFSHTRHSFKDLTEQNREKVQNILFEKEYLNIDSEKLHFHILPFYTDSDKERYKYVSQEVLQLLGKIDYTLPAFIDKILAVWQNELMINATKESSKITLTKEDLQWPMIVIALEVSSSYERDLESVGLFIEDIEEIENRYHSFISSTVNQFTSFSKIINNYNEYRNKHRSTKKSANIQTDYINDSWEDNAKILGLTDIPTLCAVERETMTKYIMIKIIRKRILIGKVRGS